VRAGYSAGVVLAVCTFATAAIVAVMERIHPKHRDWLDSHGDVRADVFHALVSMIGLPQVLEVGVKGLMLTWAVSLGWDSGIWPHEAPMVLQLALAMVTSQLGEYVMHRACHEVPLLWRLHAVHHSPTRLYWLNAARFHPLEVMLTFPITLVTLLALGAGEEVMLLVTCWTAVHGLYQHCNIDVRLGPLNWIFSMAELHRWHHSRVLSEANANYGNNILFWDIVFGTVYWPGDRDASSDIGLSEGADFPKDYLGQLASPFRAAP
jgi:sterol desaturase/sphingolipid hydroxylase (fatty acid hydroxylase superfamily)